MRDLFGEWKYTFAKRILTKTRKVFAAGELALGFNGWIDRILFCQGNGRSYGVIG
jgi:hypothetical protein